jgi:hypothetical protein
LLDYNPETGDIVWKVRRAPNKKPGMVAGCVPKGRGYMIVGIENDTWPAHRIAWALYHGEDPYPHEIDHGDRNKLNNRIGNLEVTNLSQQNANRILPHRKPVLIEWPDGSRCVARGIAAAAWLTQTKYATLKQRVRRNKMRLTRLGTGTGIEVTRFEGY